MRELHKFITMWAARVEKIIAKARACVRSKREVAEYAEYIAIVALIAVALGVGLRLGAPFAADALDNVMNTISNSL